MVDVEGIVEDDIIIVEGGMKLEEKNEGGVKLEEEEEEEEEDVDVSCSDAC